MRAFPYTQQPHQNFLKPEQRLKVKRAGEDGKKERKKGHEDSILNISDLDISSEKSSLSSIDSSQKRLLTLIEARKRAGGVKIVGQSSLTFESFYTKFSKYVSNKGLNGTSPF